MRTLVIAALLSLVWSAFGQDVTADAEKDGRDLAQQMVSKRKGISWLDWSGVVQKAYAKRGYSDPSLKDEYEEAFKVAYGQAYTELGSKVAGPRPEQTTMGGNEDVDAAIQKQLKITPEDDYEFSFAGPFDLATQKGKPVWKSNSYTFKADGKVHAGTVVVDNGKITYSKSF
jgi:hypothetical protein